MASIKILDQAYELPTIAMERFYGLQDQLRVRQQIIQAGKRPRRWGIIQLGSVRLSHEERLQELALLVSDYEAIIAGLQEGKGAYEQFFARLAAGVRDAVSSRIADLRQLEQERHDLHESESARQDKALAQLGRQQAEQLSQAVRLLGQAALLLLKKVELCREGLQKLADDQTLQQQVLSQMMGRLDAQRRAYELQQRIDRTAREVAQMAEVALQFEDYMREHFGPLQSVLEQVVQADESLHRAVTEIETITQQMLQERSLSLLASADEIEGPWLDFLVSSRIKRERLADVLSRAEQEDDVAAALDGTIATGGSATILEALDNIEAFVDLRLTPLVPEPISELPVAEPAPVSRAQPPEVKAQTQEAGEVTAHTFVPGIPDEIRVEAQAQKAGEVAEPAPVSRAQPPEVKAQTQEAGEVTEPYHEFLAALSEIEAQAQKAGEVAEPAPVPHAQPPEVKAQARKAAKAAEPAPVSRAQLPDPQMVELSGGRFLMGVKTEPEEERPLHQVALSPFSIGKYPVTFEEYDTFCEATGKEKPSDHGWGRERRPVINVSWHDALAYCKWLSEQTGRQYRLPSEAEWEYAARGGTENQAIGSGTLRLVGWYEGNSDGSTHPVGGKRPNSFGLCDLYGNVWEWVADWYGTYSADPVTDPQGPPTGYSRVIRGGCWHSPVISCRPASRRSHLPSDCNRFVGFRLARTP